MSYEKEGKENLQEQDQEHKIRITITSKNCSAIERISNELVKAAKDKNLKVISSWIGNPVFTTLFRSRAPSACQPRPFVSPPVRRPMVRVPRPGIATRWESTSASSISSPLPRPSARSPSCRSTPVWMLRSPSATKSSMVYNKNYWNKMLWISFAWERAVLWSGCKLVQCQILISVDELQQ